MTKLPAREPVEATPRRTMTPARRRRILAKTNGVCARLDCSAPAVEVDHIVCLELGGPDTDENCEGLCEPHHAAKTARDIKMIARARRLRKDLAGLQKSKRPIPCRPFDTRLTRKMDGSVVRRNP